MALDEVQFDFTKLGSTEYAHEVMVEQFEMSLTVQHIIERPAAQDLDFVADADHSHFDYDVQLHHDDFFLV